MKNSFNTLNAVMSIAEDVLSEISTDLTGAFPNSKKGKLLANVSENESETNISVLVPGINKEEINITVEKDILSIQVDAVKDDTKYKSHQWYRPAKSSVKFALTKEAYNIEGITSELKNGILTITLPNNVVEEKPAKNITIK